MPKVSVIIPIYNSEKYLKQCLDSILAQTLKDIEIICIDDGSGDGSPLIIDAYAAADHRIVAIHRKNEGLVSARKRGVQEAKGDYIGFVDSDDWIEPDMYEALYEKAQQFAACMVTSGYFLEGSYTTEHYDMVDGGFYGPSAIQKLRENTIYKLESKETGLRGSLWCKLFSAKLLRHAQAEVPDRITIAEDKLCLLNYVLCCNSAYVLKKAYYHWCIRPESMSHRKSESYLLHVNEVYRYLTSLYGHAHFTKKMRLQAEIYIMELLLLGINTRMGFENRHMLWMNPYWMDAVPDGSRLVLYGAGEAGEKYYRQIAASGGRLAYVCCIDMERKGTREDPLKPVTLQELSGVSYDYILITVKNPGKAEEVKKRLINMGIRKEQILWFEQREVYWSYIEAEGLLGQDETGKADG